MGQYALASERLSETIESAANYCCAELRLAYDHEYKEISKTRILNYAIQLDYSKPLFATSIAIGTNRTMATKRLLFRF